MKFRTEVLFTQPETKMHIDDKIFSIGSCFAAEIAQFFQQGQLQTLSNPFGTIFNPLSISTAVKRIHDASFYTEEDIVLYEGQYISLDHHSKYDSEYLHKTLEKINGEIEKANTFLRETNWVIITLGTSFIYEFLPKNKLVANCHKIPQKFFQKKLLSHTEITDALTEMVINFKDICSDDVQILFTVSPVRHTKDGLIENQWSKAKLISAVHEILPQFSNCSYLPIYEVMMDDLRDYRFYKEDLIHLNNQAKNYIFEKFGEVYFTAETHDFMAENLKIHQALQHRAQNENSTKHLDFQQKLQIRIETQQKKVKRKIF